MDLSSGSDLGGAYVTVGADLAPLRAKIAEAKQIAASAERDNGAKLVIGADASRVRAEIASLSRTAGTLKLGVTADITAAKTAIGGIVAPPLKVGVSADTAAVKREIDQLRNDAARIVDKRAAPKAATEQLASAPRIALSPAQGTIRIPRSPAEPLGVAGDMYDLRRPTIVEAEERGKIIRQQKSEFDERVKLAGESGERAGRKYAEEESRGLAIRRRRYERLGFSGEREGSRAGGGERRFSNFNPFSTRGLDRAFGSAIAGFVVAEGIKVAGDVVAANRKLGSGNFITREEGKIETIQAAQGVPLVGSLVGSLDKISGASVAIQRNIDDQKAAAAGGAALRARSVEIAASRAALRGDSDAVIEIQGEEQKRATRQNVIAAAAATPQGYRPTSIAGIIGNAFTGLSVSTTTPIRLPALRRGASNTGRNEATPVDAEQQLIDEQRAELSHRRQGEREAAFIGNAGTDYAIQASQFRATGKTASAVSLDRLAEQQQLEAAGKRQLIGVNNKDDRQLIADQNRKDMELLLARQAEDSAERQRAGTSLVAGTQAQIKQSNLRIGFRSDEAAQEAIRESYRPNIEQAEQTYGKGSAQAKAVEAERDAKLAEQTAQVKVRVTNTVAAAEADARVATLRANKDSYAADLASFQESQRRKMEAMKQTGATAKEIAAQQKADAAELKEFQTQQGRQRQQATLGYQTRQAVASASGQQLDQLAGVIAQIGQLRQERIAAPKDQQGEVAKTQLMELEALKKQLTLPRGYATDYEAGREAKGGPGGVSGKDLGESIKAIDTERGNIVAGDKGPKARAAIAPPAGRATAPAPSGMYIGHDGASGDATYRIGRDDRGQDTARQSARQRAAYAHHNQQQLENARGQLRAAHTPQQRQAAQQHIQDLNDEREARLHPRAGRAVAVDPGARAVQGAQQLARGLDVPGASPDTDLLKEIRDYLKQLVDKEPAGLAG